MKSDFIPWLEAVRCRAATHSPIELFISRGKLLSRCLEISGCLRYNSVCTESQEANTACGEQRQAGSDL
ncbi:hypothetical protein CesoFtcFv8_002918 [Champsocephalus esox]|uniref:Uncharacterized protein n=2 Tax=Champsocephalus TaxID=52236 RepID=A0AAN8E4G8_CHAGU|nr:hypothetical protein CesoFtcFv8_002918 [Champsocephalus esox]KAK5934595.1 hypothetical protein CgunFtcFv8_014981 [Champsocephalus gunnari]